MPNWKLHRNLLIILLFVEMNLFELNKYNNLEDLECINDRTDENYNNKLHTFYIFKRNKKIGYQIVFVSYTRFGLDIPVMILGI